jgi:C-terminal processing protease CtpA/Prc
MRRQKSKIAATGPEKQRNANDSQDEVARRRRGPLQGAFAPMSAEAVLVGPSTTSAAEITAAALQDRMTNGAVVTAQAFDLADGGSMMISMQDYVRLKGQRIEGVGVDPDIWILPTLEDIRAGRDPALERAIDELRGLSPFARK